MDTSETYIKMCEKAPRELTKFRWDDQRQFAVCAYHGCLVEYHEGLHEWQCPKMDKAQWAILGKDYSDDYEAKLWRKLQKSDDWCEDKHWIQLPRQDQLQEMVKPRHITRLVEDLDKFTIDNESCWKGNIKVSMEMLWLCFVMKEKYNKIWNGEEWIASST